MKIAPSVLTADFTNLKDEIKSVESADLLHIDIMDGHFVPNISFGPAITKEIAKCTKLELDVHLMVTDPINWIDRFSLKETKYITIHLEAKRVKESIKAIKDNNKLVGLSIKPKTSVDKVIPYLDEIDLILIMTVEPGFGGQVFIDEMLEKITTLTKIREEKNLNFLIEVDGGINSFTGKLVKDKGADIAVVGSYLFNQKNKKDTIEALR